MRLSDTHTQATRYDREGRGHQRLQNERMQTNEETVARTAKREKRGQYKMWDRRFASTGGQKGALRSNGEYNERLYTLHMLLWPLLCRRFLILDCTVCAALLPLSAVWLVFFFICSFFAVLLLLSPLAPSIPLLSSPSLLLHSSVLSTLVLSPTALQCVVVHRRRLAQHSLSLLPVLHAHTHLHTLTDRQRCSTRSRSSSSSRPPYLALSLPVLHPYLCRPPLLLLLLLLLLLPVPLPLLHSRS